MKGGAVKKPGSNTKKGTAMMRGLWTAAVVGWLVNFDIAGQQVLAPPPVDYSGISPTLLTTGTNQPGSIPLSEPSPRASDALFKLGPVKFWPHVMYRFVYGDGVPAAPGESVKTAINELYPGVLLALGDHWHLDYTPSLRYYSSDRFRDTFDNHVVFTGGTVFEDWTLGLSQSYASTSEPRIETGTQTDEENYLTALSAAYQINTALSLELGANQSFRFVGENQGSQQLTDSKTWSTLDWLNYQISTPFGAGLGIGVAYDDVSLGSDMVSGQVQGRVTWRPGEKLFVSASGGVEDRKFLDSEGGNAVNPIFGLSLQYQIFEPTSLSLAATHLVAPSYFAGQISETTTLTAGLQQRLVRRLYLDLTGGFTKSRYSSSTTLVTVNRDDHGTFFNARLRMQFLRRASVAVFFQQTDNTSTDTGYDVSSTQAGLELGYRY